MGAIGDYIHYSATGYINHGITLRGQPSDAATIFNAQRSKIINSQINREAMTPKERQELENALTQLMRPSGSNEEIEATNELWRDLIRELEKQFNGEIIGQINRATGNIRSSTSVNMSNFNKIRQRGAKIRNNTLLKGIGILNNAINSISSRNKTKQELLKDLDNIYSLASKLTGETRANLQSTGYNLQTKKVTGTITVQSREYNWDEAINVVDAINRLGAKLSSSLGLQKGTMFEYMIAAAPLVGQGYSLKQLQDAILHVVGGASHGSSVQFDARDFSAVTDMQKVLGSSYHAINDNIYESVRATQNKVDVEYVYNYKTVGISAKNINFKAGNNIHLVTDMPLTSVLVSAGSDYANHYLNVLATHGNNQLGGLINLAHESMKITSLLLAFEGYKGNKAEVFVVNDNTTGTVKVYNISTLILEAIKSLDSYFVTVNGRLPVESIQFSNNWNTDGYSGRITELLASVHSQKIRVALNPAMI